MTSIIEIPKEDLYPHEVGRIQMTSSNGVQIRFTRTKTHPFHVGVSIYPESQPKGTPMTVFYIPLDMLRDVGAYLQAAAVQLTHEWTALTPDQQSAYNAQPLPMPHPADVIVNRDDLRFMLDELEEARDQSEIMLTDPFAVRSMEMGGFSKDDMQGDIDRMTAILESYEKER